MDPVPPADALKELAGKDTEDFFRGVSSAITTAVKEHFEQRLRAETEAIRQAYDSALLREKAMFHAHLRVLGEDLGVSSPNYESEIFRDVSMLNNDMTKYLQKQATFQECPYSPAIALMLSEVMNSVELLNAHCRSRLSSMSMTFCPRGLTGKEYPLEVRPTEETVRDVKQKLRAEYCKTCEVKICSSLDGHVELDDSEKLMNYNLNQEFTVILVDVLHTNELAHLAFQDTRSMAFDSVSGTAGTVLNSQHVEAINIRGKTGVNVTEDGCLVLPKPVILQDSGWTMSCWFLAPVPHSTRNRHLLDGNLAEERVCVALSRGKLRNFAEGNYLRGFNVSTLSEGWHHLAVIGKGNLTTYWMDGKLLGQKYGITTGLIACVANSRGQRYAWGHLADFRIFGIAADRLQVEGLFIAGGGTLSEEGESWQDGIVRQNNEVDSDSMSSYSSLQSYMDSDFSDAG